MTSDSVRSYLPVPEIREENLNHSRKQLHKRNEFLRVRRPPKLNKHHDSFSRSFNSFAHIISFKEPSETGEDLSPMYNRTSTESYFDQCFDTLSKLGEGSFGEVFKVRSREDGLLYAIKKSKQFFRSEVYRQERLEEVKRYEQFSNHDHCVTLYKAWEQDDRLYMQMELCQGSLENYLAKMGYIPEEQVWSILLDLLLALKSLHDRNLIHLDIKLENILVGDDGTCKLGDFGLVVDVDRANLLQATEGDSRYISPELLQGRFSKSADIFSLGISILELSCNLELPPNGPLWQELRSGIFPTDFIRQISPELQDMIKSMMDPDPNKRPTVDQLLSHKKLVSLQLHRRRWGIFNRMKQCYRKSRRLFWAKVCNFKNNVFTFFLRVLVLLRLKEHVTPSNCNNSYSESFLSIPSAQNSPVHNFSNDDYIINSTPLNPNNSSLRRLRKDLTKTSFSSLNDSCKNSPTDEQSTNYKRNSFLTVDYVGTPSPFCKQLFKNEDSD